MEGEGSMAEMKQYFWIRSDGEVRELSIEESLKMMGQSRRVFYIHERSFGMFNKSSTVWKKEWDQIRAMMNEELKNYWGFK